MVYRPARYQPVKSRMISAEPIDAISAPTHAAMSEKRLNRGACERNQGCILHTSSALRMASTPLHTSLSSPKTPPTVKNRMMDTTPSKVIAPTAIANQWDATGSCSLPYLLRSRMSRAGEPLLQPHLAITCEEVPHRQQQSQHACGGDRVVEECDVGVGECSGSQPDWEDPTGIPGPWFELAEWDCDDYQGVEGEGGEAHE